MESYGDEASHQHPKRSKPKSHTQLPSTSLQDSSFKMPILPAELINEILLRVPVHSLLKLRCVSKSWLALISSPQFIKTHLSLSTNNKDQTRHRLMMGFSMCDFNLKDCSFTSLFCNSITEASDLNYPMKLREETYRGVGSVNGLICLVHGKKNVFIWNPSIRKYKKLPNSRPKLRYDDYLYGFGYDELHDEYKVVGVFIIYGTPRHVDVKIYSLKGDSWRNVPYSLDGWYFSNPAVFVNGKLHWTTTAGPEDKHKKIISFDLADENWGRVEQPCYGERGMLVLGVLGNDLSMFSHYLATGVDVWVMKECGLKESWIKMFTIKYPKLPNHMYLPSLFLSNIGDIMVGYGSTFIMYNQEDDSFRLLDVINFDKWWGKAEIYIESLVSPLSAERIEDATKTKSKQRLRKLRSRQSNNY